MGGEGKGGGEEGEKGGEGRRNRRKDMELRECILYSSIHCQCAIPGRHPPP